MTNILEIAEKYKDYGLSGTPLLPGHEAAEVRALALAVLEGHSTPEPTPEPLSSGPVNDEQLIEGEELETVLTGGRAEPGTLEEALGIPAIETDVGKTVESEQE